ncbi:MAG: hypothetical protein C4318_03775 [Acidimicrobiia bacterium]
MRQYRETGVMSSPEIRILKKISIAAAIMLPSAILVSVVLGGRRTVVSVAIGGLVAFLVLAVTAYSAAIFSGIDDRAIAASYTLGFFVKLAILTALLVFIKKLEYVSIHILAVSMGVSYLALLGVGAIGYGHRVEKTESSVSGEPEVERT